jgi:hypothetical protein
MKGVRQPQLTPTPSVTVPARIPLQVARDSRRWFLYQSGRWDPRLASSVRPVLLATTFILFASPR